MYPNSLLPKKNRCRVVGPYVSGIKPKDKKIRKEKGKKSIYKDGIMERGLYRGSHEQKARKPHTFWRTSGERGHTANGKK